MGKHIHQHTHKQTHTKRLKSPTIIHDHYSDYNNHGVQRFFSPYYGLQMIMFVAGSKSNAKRGGQRVIITTTMCTGSTITVCTGTLVDYDWMNYN